MNDKTGDDKKSDRRRFLQGAAAAGVMGAAALTPGFVPQAAAQRADAAEDPPRPPGMKTPGWVDCRFPITFEKSIPAATSVMMQYYTALNQRDLRGMASALTYPHATYDHPFGTYMGTDALVIESAEQLMADPPPSMNVTGKGNQLLEDGCYDILDSVTIQVYGPFRVAFALTYSRFFKTGQKLLQCDGLYWVTDDDGKWGIEEASTIFTAADQIGVRYRDAEEASLRMERDAWLAFQLNSSQESAGVWLTPGKQAAIAGAPSNFKAAKEGTQMDSFKIKGVKSRLRVQDVPDPPPLGHGGQLPANYDSFKEGAGEGVGHYHSTMVAPYQQVLHASPNKVHVYGGLCRYLYNWRRVSELKWLGVYTFHKGKWGRAVQPSTTEYYQDFSNDV
jgi:hypothetical protein